MIKAIIFDLWGTLLYSKLSPRYTRQLHKIIKPEISYDDFMRKIGIAFMTQRFNDEKEGIENICNKFEMDFSMELMRQILQVLDKNSLFIKQYNDLDELEELKQIYKLALLSNTEYFSLDNIRSKLKLDLFDVRAFSFDTGLLKPDSLAFKNVLRKLDVKPYEAVMVGNNLGQDINPAKNLGINTIWMNRRNRLRIEHTIFNLKQLKEKIADS